MRRFFVIGFLAGLTAFAARPVAAQQPAAAAGPAPVPAAPAPSSQGEIQTPDRAGTANLTGVAEAPLHDLNVIKQSIPPVLLSAVTNPYEKPNPMTCPEITRQVHILDVALGADFDEAESPQKPSLT